MPNLETVNGTEASLKVIADEQYAALLSSFDARQVDQESDVRCLGKSQMFYSYPIALFIRNDSTLIKPINKIIRRATEAGLVNVWLNRLLRERKAKKADLVIGPIELSHLSFIFLLGTGFILLALISFIGEIRIFKRSHAPNAARIWRWLEIFIDGKRHLFVFNDV